MEVHIVDLLEKRERAIYQLFLLLREHTEPINLKEACQHLEISRSTLLRYIESFSEEAKRNNLGLELLLQDEEIFLKRSPTLSIQELLAYLCQFSLKYQILLYLFDKNEFSIPGLSQALLISEATLNRQLSSLNKLLGSFEISIRGGRMKGSELQVRYFYYQLFWNTQSISTLQADRVFKEQLTYLPIFERFYQSALNPRQAHQMALWLTIVYKRMRLKDLDFQACYRLISPYKEHKFYRNLRSLFLTLSQQFSSSFQEGDTMSVFAFLFSQGILEAHQLEQLLGFGGPIMEATTWAFKQIKASLETDIPVEEGELYHLNQIFSHLYFFTSNLENDLDCLDAYDGDLQQAATSILQSVYQDIYGREGESCLDRHCISLLHLFSYLTQLEPCLVQVGFASSYPTVISLPILQGLQERLAGKPWILLDDYEPNKSYDLVICYDYPMEAAFSYQLYGKPTPQDFSQLKEILAQLHKEKKEKAKRFVARSPFLIERR